MTSEAARSRGGIGGKVGICADVLGAVDGVTVVVVVVLDGVETSEGPESRTVSQKDRGRFGAEMRAFAMTMFS